MHADALAKFKDDVTTAALEALDRFTAASHVEAPPMFVNLPMPLVTEADLERALAQESM